MQTQEITKDNLPLSMRYSASSVNAIEGTSTMARYDSVNGSSFVSTGANQILIKIKADGFLDTSKHYLNFNVALTGHGGAIDGNANSFFDLLQISSNGVILESIDRYAVYSGIKRNWQSDLSQVNRESA